MTNTLPSILHVDDEEDIREIAKISLESIGGLEIVQCASGQEALEVAPKLDPDIFLLDVMMPSMTGIELLKKLRKLEQFATTPIIFMTAKVHGSEITELMNLGAVAVIKKPFDTVTVSGEIIEIWRSVLNEGRQSA